MNETEHRQVLKTAKALVARGWTQGYVAEDPPGHSCCPMSDVACRWCLLGACERAMSDHGHLQEDSWLKMLAVLKRAISASGEISPVVWNDTPSRKRPQVLALLDKAIESLASNERTP